jgi:hypothetical protein
MAAHRSGYAAPAGHATGSPMKAPVRHPGPCMGRRSLFRLLSVIALAVLLLAALMPVPPACDAPPTPRFSRTA